MDEAVLEETPGKEGDDQKASKGAPVEPVRGKDLEDAPDLKDSDDDV
jgi:hypothetical protein